MEIALSIIALVLSAEVLILLGLYHRCNEKAKHLDSNNIELRKLLAESQQKCTELLARENARLQEDIDNMRMFLREMDSKCPLKDKEE